MITISKSPATSKSEYFSHTAPSESATSFHAFWTEFEYGATAWWTTEFYLDGQTTLRQHGVHGLPLENRFRLLKHEHFIIPSSYLEYERRRGQISKSSKATMWNRTFSFERGSPQEHIQVELRGHQAVAPYSNSVQNA